MESRHSLSSSSGATLVAGRATTKATTSSPHSGCGRPTTETSMMSGWRSSTSLDLAWIDIAAAADDHVLGTVAQGQKPFLVKAAQIAGVQPTTAQGFGTGHGVVPIAFHDAVAAGDHLADFAARELTVTIVDNLDENPSARHPTRTEPIAPAGMRPLGVQALVEGGNRHRRLALSVELVEPRPEQLQSALEIGHVHWTAAIEDRPKVSQIGGGHRGRMDESGQHRRRREHRDPRMTLQRVEDRLDLEMREHDLMPAAQQMRQCVKAGAVRQRTGA